MLLKNSIKKQFIWNSCRGIFDGTVV